MQLNTRTGKITLLKRERETLVNAWALLTQVGRLTDEGNGGICDDCTETADTLQKIIDYLDGKPVAVKEPETPPGIESEGDDPQQELPL